MTYRLNQVGSDLELFLKDKQGNPMPVVGLLGGTKEAPKQILQHLGPGFAVQEDNVMVEFNVPPTEDFGMWMENFRTMDLYLRGWADAREATLCAVPSMQFEPGQLQTLQAQTFGCEPDFNIWTMSQNEVDTRNPALRTLRTAGGHVHVSFFKDDRDPEPQDLTRVVKMLDLYLGVPSLTYDKDQTRRAIYGKAGAFRPKPYGLEYRVLSGAWFKDRDTIEWVFESVHRAFQHLSRNTEEAIDQMFEEHGPRLQATINEGKEKEIDFFCNLAGLYFPRNTGMKKKSKSVPGRERGPRFRFEEIAGILNGTQTGRVASLGDVPAAAPAPVGDAATLNPYYTPNNWADVEITPVTIADDPVTGESRG